jgi:hypothetical protein
MARIETLAEQYGRHIATPWQRIVAGAQRVLMIVYEKDLERTLRARKAAFEMATKQAGHDWHELDVSSAFASWVAGEEYRDAYFAAPEDLRLKVEAEFPEYVASLIRSALTRPEVTESSVVGLFGVGALLGFSHVSPILKLVEGDIRGRLAVFFPGQWDKNSYRLLDGRAGFNYLAIPITLHSTGVSA